MAVDAELTDIIESVDIAEYIGQYVELSEKDGELWGLSPFKDEKTPSFSIRPEQNVFYDFSSGRGGNVINFIKYYNDCSIGKAINILKEYVGADGIVVNKRLPATMVIKRFKPHEKQLKECTAKILPSNYMNRFEDKPDKLKTWIDEGISQDVMKRYQVMYDVFSDRLMFPIRDQEGNIINIQGRTLDPDFKEKGLRKYTYLQNMGSLDTIFGLSENMESILEKKEIIVFEGAKSVMLAETWGITNAVAVQTSHLNPHQLRLLIKLGVRVVFALDEEVDIAKDENIIRLKHYARVEWVKNREKILDEKMAPVDAGFENWKYLYERRVRLN